MARPLRAHLLRERERESALDHLRRDPRSNLQLIDYASVSGRRATSREIPAELVAAWGQEGLASLASLRPSIAFATHCSPEAFDVLAPFVDRLPLGLIKSEWAVVSELWERLRARGRDAVVDRGELAYVVTPAAAVLGEVPPGSIVRPAERRDLDDLVYAARASLREENRPDPFDGDPVGFRGWVAGRMDRARVVEAKGRVSFVGYADVRRSEGWLIQGVYTWPESRRRGFASAGMAALLRQAFSQGADHVQLAVVEGNEPALGLYERLGFRAFLRLRTLLFQ